MSSATECQCAGCKAARAKPYKPGDGGDALLKSLFAGLPVGSVVLAFDSGAEPDSFPSPQISDLRAIGIKRDAALIAYGFANGLTF